MLMIMLSQVNDPLNTPCLCHLCSIFETAKVDTLSPPGIIIASVPEKKVRPRGGGGPAQKKTSRVYSGSWDKTVTLLETLISSIKASTTKHNPRPVLIMSSAPQIKLWTVGNPKMECMQTIGEEEGTGHETGVNTMVAAADGSAIYSASEDGAIKKWQLPGCEQAWSVNDAHKGAIHCLLMSPTGTELYSASDDETIKSREVSTGEQIRVYRGHQGPVHALVFIGEALLSGGWDSTLRVWSEQGDCLDVQTEHMDAIYALAESKDGNGCYSGSEDGNVKEWTKIHTGQMVCTATYEGHTARVTVLALDRVSGLLYSGGDDKCIRAWHTPSGGCVQVRTGHQHGISALCVAPEGYELYSGSVDEQLFRWTLRKREKEVIMGMPNMEDIDDSLTGDARAAEMLRRERDALQTELQKRKEEYQQEQWRLEVWRATILDLC